MTFEPTLFNAHKLNHYHLLFPSPKKKKKKKRPPLCVARDKYLLESIKTRSTPRSRNSLDLSRK